MAMASVGKRKAERRGCQVKAQVMHPSGGEPIDCLILDFSATGARAKLNAAAELPSRFKLYIPSRPETKNVILRWVKGLEFGVEYSTGLADERTFFELIERVAVLEKTGGAGGDPAALDELAKRITTLEARFADHSPASGKDDGVAQDAAEAFERRFQELAGHVEGQIKRSEQFVSTRMDQAEERLRALLAPDVAERLARLEAAVEAGAFAAPPPAPEHRDAGPDPRIVSRIADLEAKLMSAPRASGAPEASALEARIQKAEQLAEERAARIERFLSTRIDDIEMQMIAAPQAPAPVRSSEVADIDYKLHELTARFDEMKAEARAAPGHSMSAPDEMARLLERVSDLEMSVMELRIEAPAGKAVDTSIEQRIAEIEGRHAEIIGTLRNLLALLTASEGRRQAG